MDARVLSPHRRGSFDESRETASKRARGIREPNDFEKVEIGKMAAAGGWRGDIAAFVRIGREAAKRIRRRRLAGWRRHRARRSRRVLRRGRSRRTRRTRRTRAKATSGPDGPAPRAPLASDTPREAP